MQQGICNPEFYGDLVYKLKKIVGNPNFSNLLKRIANRFKRAGYSLDIMRQTACLLFNPIMVEGYAALLSWFKHYFIQVNYTHKCNYSKKQRIRKQASMKLISIFS